MEPGLIDFVRRGGTVEMFRLRAFNVVRLGLLLRSHRPGDSRRSDGTPPRDHPLRTGTD